MSRSWKQHTSCMNQASLSSWCELATNSILPCFARKEHQARRTASPLPQWHCWGSRYQRRDVANRAGCCPAQPDQPAKQPAFWGPEAAVLFAGEDAYAESLNLYRATAGIYAPVDRRRGSRPYSGAIVLVLALTFLAVPILRTAF